MKILAQQVLKTQVLIRGVLLSSKILIPKNCGRQDYKLT